MICELKPNMRMIEMALIATVVPSVTGNVFLK